MRIAPRTLLCASAFRVGGSGAETGFDELRELCDDAGDKRSLAIGMTGLVAQQFTAHRPEASEARLRTHPTVRVHRRPHADRRILLGSDSPPSSRAARIAGGFAVGGARHHPRRRGCHQRRRHFRITAGDRVHLSRQRPMEPRASRLAGRFRRKASTWHARLTQPPLSAVTFWTYITAIPWTLPADATALRTPRKRWTSRSGRGTISHWTWLGALEASRWCIERAPSVQPGSPCLPRSAKRLCATGSATQCWGSWTS